MGRSELASEGFMSFEKSLSPSENNSDPLSRPQELGLVCNEVITDGGLIVDNEICRKLNGFIESRLHI